MKSAPFRGYVAGCVSNHLLLGIATYVNMACPSMNMLHGVHESCEKILKITDIANCKETRLYRVQHTIGEANASM